MRKTSTVLVLVLAVTMPGVVQAQEKFGFEIGAYTGFQNWQDRNFQIGPPQAISPINMTFRYEDKLDYGVRFNLLSRGYWGGEFDYNFQRNTVTLTRELFTPIALTGNIHHFFYNTMFYPTRYESPVTPFATGGIGMAAYGLSDDAKARARISGLGNLEDWDRRFAFNYGGGVKAIIASSVGLRFDIRHNFSDVPSYGLPKESPRPAQPVLPIQGKLQSVEISGGIYFRAFN